MPHTSCMAAASKYNKYAAQPPPARVSLRQFALVVHETEGVSNACVSLQDRFDLDVNILLLGAYIGVQGKTLAAENVDAARAVVDEWHNAIVRALRAVRRRLKSGPAPATSWESGRTHCRHRPLQAVLSKVPRQQWKPLFSHTAATRRTVKRQEPSRRSRRPRRLQRGAIDEADHRCPRRRFRSHSRVLRTARDAGRRREPDGGAVTPAATDFARVAARSPRPYCD
jgi:uncharacterized protein (TIGR02444 family)